MLKPLVSIIIPVYNGEKFLIEAIESCINQTYTNIEIIVVNDGSTDNTELICKEYKDKIKYLSKKNGGVSTALNLGINESKGEYISWLSHDDFYLPNKITDEINVVLKSKKNSIIFSNYLVVNEKGKKCYEINFDKKFYLNENSAYLLIYSCSINGCAMLLPKIIFDKFGLFDTNLKYTQDYKKWMEIISCDFAYNDSFVTCSRRHKNQGTELFLCDSSELDELWYGMIKSLYKNNNYDRFLGYKESLYFFKNMFKNNPIMLKTISYINVNLGSIDEELIKNNISKKIYDFGWEYSIWKKVIIYYKLFGFKKLIIKICNVKNCR